MSEEQMLELAKQILIPNFMLNVVGVIISLCTSYIPGFREKYAAMKPVEKSLGQLIIVSIVVLLVGILSWTKVLMIVPNTTFGALLLGASWVSALVVNQTTYQFSTPTASVLLVKELVRKESLVEAKVEVKEEISETK